MPPSSRWGDLQAKALKGLVSLLKVFKEKKRRIGLSEESLLVGVCVFIGFFLSSEANLRVVGVSWLREGEFNIAAGGLAKAAFWKNVDFHILNAWICFGSLKQVQVFQMGTCQQQGILFL